VEEELEEECFQNNETMAKLYFATNGQIMNAKGNCEVHI
jgi:hypothetical protein